jgi:hypothetical protein
LRPYRSSPEAQGQQARSQCRKRLDTHMSSSLKLFTHRGFLRALGDARLVVEEPIA